MKLADSRESGCSEIFWCFKEGKTHFSDFAADLL